MNIYFFIIFSFLFPNVILIAMKVTNVSFPINCNKYFRGTYQFNITLLCNDCSDSNPSIEEDILIPLKDGNVNTSLNATCFIPNTTQKTTISICRLTSISRSYPLNLIEQETLGTNVNITVPNNVSNITTNENIGVLINTMKISERQFIDNTIENEELGRVFSLFFEEDIYKGNITSLIVTNDSNIVNINLTKCNYSGSQLSCKPDEGTLLGDSRRPKDIFTYRVYYNDSCGTKNTGVVLQVNSAFFLRWNFIKVLFLGFFIIL